MSLLRRQMVEIEQMTDGITNKINFFESNNDTIAAIGTPPGIGAVAIVRMSGREALPIADRIFRGSVIPSQAKTHTVHVGKIKTAEDTVIDQVILLVMRAPRSYTGDDTIEIQSHGGFIACRMILREMLKNGARQAEPGEFTRRAFLHGRLDLIQAEAIGDLIHAKTDLEGLLAVQQLNGVLSSKIRQLRDNLIHLVGLLEVAIDFSEEEIDPYNPHELVSFARNSEHQIKLLIGNIERGNIVKAGIQVTITGQENVGKSSIFNCLVNKGRAIVTAQPGTTRDVLEEPIVINGFPFRLYDTAGIRTGVHDLVELEGIRRSHDMIKQAQIILLVLDQSRPLTDHVTQLYAAIKGQLNLVILNKDDLPSKLNLTDHFFQQIPNEKIIKVSTISGAGISNLTRKLAELADHIGLKNAESITLGNDRQIECLKNSLTAIAHGINSLERNLSPELIAVDFQAAIRRLEEVIGSVAPDDILNNIFSKFCIGK